MAGEPILVVDDTPVNLKLTRVLLVNEGFSVLTAASAEEALEMLRNYRPRLILADIQLPGMDGLQMTRLIKQDEQLRGIPVVALTAFAMMGDEEKAMAAGCDGYITKPIDTRTLGEHIRQFLAVHGESAPPAAPPTGHESIPEEEMLDLRRRFLQEGQQRTHQLLLDLEDAFDANQGARAVHQWVGTGGLLGYSALARLAHEVEVLLLERPLDTAQVRESLTDLLLAFGTPGEGRDAPIAGAIIEPLRGKCAAIVGLPANETQRLCVALERAHARAVVFELDSPADAAALARCDLVVAYVRPGGGVSAWLDPTTACAAGIPTILVGSRDDLLAVDPAMQAAAADVLMDSWQPEEALVRLSLALAHHGPRKSPSAPGVPAAGSVRESAPGVSASESVRVLVADDDAAARELAADALRSFGMECQMAADGTEALEAARRWRPDAAILAVNMPGMGGHEVLAAMRAADLPARVLLLTSHQRESDIIRGFALGADDYMVKPLSPMELAARVKRLVLP